MGKYSFSIIGNEYPHTKAFVNGYFSLDIWEDIISAHFVEKPPFEIGDVVTFDGRDDYGRHCIIDGDIKDVQRYESEARGVEWHLIIAFKRYEDIYLCEPIYDDSEKRLFGYFTSDEALNLYIKRTKGENAQKPVVEETQYGKALYYVRPKCRVDALSSVLVERTYKKDGDKIAKGKNKGMKGGERHISVLCTRDVNYDFYI